MESPEDAVLRDGYWAYRPQLAPLVHLDLARSDAVADWQLCLDGACRSLGSYLPGAASNVTMRGCRD